MRHAALWLLLLLAALPQPEGLRFDAIPNLQQRPVQDSALQAYVRTSARWLQVRAVTHQYPLLNVYAEQLRLVLRSECTHCVDYYEAAGVLGLLGKTANQIMKDGRSDVHYAVLRRSYVAAVWLLQRSKLFLWETTHLQSSVLSTMFRLYLSHVRRAKGKTISLHHISKCGGTTMCQLAASNRCSNPHLSQEKNCVLNDRLDGPIWMIGHNVTPQGVVLNPAIGTVDADPPPDALPQRPSHRRFANEPKMDMWLMYACPYVPNGRMYNCRARSNDAQDSGTTFMANERSLTREAGVTQVCPEFMNAVILREPVPHAISIMAEVKYRYARQLSIKHNIRSWQPSAWNLTWWETLGPSLVGNYATRTLIGRDSFCRSAANMSDHQLSEATDSLLGFDMVMTLGRSQDIDLLITTMLGWPARNFSSQPGARVREVSQALVAAAGVSSGGGGGGSTGRRLLMADGDGRDSSSDSSSDSSRDGSSDSSSDGSSDGSSALPGAGVTLPPASTAGDSRHGSRGSSSSSSSAAAALALGEVGGGPARQLLQVSQSRAISSLGASAAAGAAAAHAAAHGATSHAGYHYYGSHVSHAAHLYHPHGKLHTAHGSKDLLDGRHVRLPRKRRPGHLIGDGHSRPAGSIHHGGVPAGNIVPLDGHGAAKGAAAIVDLTITNSAASDAAAGAPGLPPEVLERHGAVALVSTTWRDRQAERLGLLDKAAVTEFTGEPRIEHTGSHSPHGSHLVRVLYHGPSGAEATELWHAFPRHSFAFLDSDVRHLEKLTRLDGRLWETADLMFNLDTAWLQTMLLSSHYRKKLKTVMATGTACGFAGQMPVELDNGQHY